MIQPYSQPLLQQHFPSYRDPPPRDVFELAIACCGGTSTGPYVAGVLDFIWEAFEEWRKAAAAGQAPDHKVIIRDMVGASAGGLSLGLATIATLKQYPHVYDDRLWATYHQADPANVPAVQPKTDNPHYRAWVSEINLDRLLSNPQEVESGQIYLFHGAPAEICDAILLDSCTRPDATGRDFVYHPLEFRATIGNLKGVPYALDYNTLGHVAAQVSSQWFESHRDNIAFAAITAPMGGTVDEAANGGASTGPLGPAPDAHELNSADLCPTAASPVHTLFRAAMISTSAIPLVFEIKKVPENPTVYDWRAGYWDRDANNNAGRAVVDLPAWNPPGTPAGTYDYAATDGGLFDNRPFDVAHNRLAGPRGQNPQEGMGACRAIIMVDPLADDAEPPPWDPDKPGDPNKPPTAAGRLFAILQKLVFSPVMQDRMDALDLAQIKDESIYSRFLIAPSRENPNTGRGWTPSQSLLGAPFDAFLGFAAQAYREHDFLLGRRNAQQFLRESFALPAAHALFAGRTGWTTAEQAMVDAQGTPHRPLVPLRGRAADEQPLPIWNWQALSDPDIDRYKSLASARADAIFTNLTSSLGFVARNAAKLAWKVFGRGQVLGMFTDGLRNSRAGLSPTLPDRA